MRIPGAAFGIVGALHPFPRRLAAREVEKQGGKLSLLDTIEDPNAADPEKSFDAVNVKEQIAEAISRLPEREKLVVTLYYYEELTLREIGEVLGVTESRVSQLHTKAILRLKARLGGASARDPGG